MNNFVKYLVLLLGVLAVGMSIIHVNNNARFQHDLTFSRANLLGELETGVRLLEDDTWNVWSSLEANEGKAIDAQPLMRLQRDADSFDGTMRTWASLGFDAQPLLTYKRGLADIAYKICHDLYRFPEDDLNSKLNAVQEPLDHQLDRWTFHR